MQCDVTRGRRAVADPAAVKHHPPRATGHDVNARDKNKLFNLVWDLTCSGHGLRTALFEALNATPAPALRDDLYRIHDNPEARSVMRELAGLD